jgi:pyridoxamine 5'-phosphate oxidase
MWPNSATPFARRSPPRAVPESAAEVPSFAQPLRELDVDRDPYRQFERWFQEAKASGVRMPEAAAVATATPDGVPSVRMVLVKQTGPSGFAFYSNFDSRKGQELAANARAALLFYWDALGRQVRIEGAVARMSEEESARYIRSRPRGSQLSALASPQSRVVESRDWLEHRVAELAAEYDARELPLPGGWGGFRLRPAGFEFWQHREDRLHDRLRYTPDGEAGWELERLAP